MLLGAICLTAERTRENVGSGRARLTQKSLFSTPSSDSFRGECVRASLELSKMVPYSKNELLQGMIGPLRTSPAKSLLRLLVPHLVERGCTS